MEKKNPESEFETEVKRAVEHLQQGGVILYPTDTIWGLGCDATNSEAVKKIYGIKKRQESKSMLVLVANEESLGKLTDIPEQARGLIKDHEGPLTIVYPLAKNVAPELIAADGSLGIRITEEAFSKTLCKKFGKPIVSTSANISNNRAPQFYKEIDAEIKASVDYIVNYRREDTTPHLPSSIIKIESGGNVIKIR